MRCARRRMKMLDGVVEADHVFCVLYELDEADDWRDEAVWHEGGADDRHHADARLRAAVSRRRDRDAGPARRVRRRRSCNRWLHSANTWLSMPAWQRVRRPDADARATSSMSPAGSASTSPSATTSPRSRSCFQRDGHRLRLRPRLSAGARRSANGRAPCRNIAQWVETGELIATPGNMTDYPTIEADLKADCERFDVKDDRHRAVRRDAPGREPGRGRPAGAHRKRRTRRCSRRRRRSSRRASRRGSSGIPAARF